MSATAANKARVRSQLATIVPDGGTDHMSALRMALALKPEVIFFLTDADLMTNGDVNEILAEAGTTRIQAVEFGRGHPGRADPPASAGHHDRRLVPLHRRQPVPPGKRQILTSRRVLRRRIAAQCAVFRAEKLTIPTKRPGLVCRVFCCSGDGQPPRLRGCERIDSESRIPNGEWIGNPAKSGLMIS